MRGRRGFTLIETTVAIALLAVIVVAILSAFSAITLAARRHQQVTTLDRLTRSEAEYIKSQAYTTGATSGTYSTNPASGYTVTYQVLFYSAATNPPTFLTSNPDVGLQEIVLTVNGSNGSSEVLDFLKEQP